MCPISCMHSWVRPTPLWRDVGDAGYHAARAAALHKPASSVVCQSPCNDLASVAIGTAGMQQRLARTGAAAWARKPLVLQKAAPATRADWRASSASDACRWRRFAVACSGGGGGGGPSAPPVTRLFSNLNPDTLKHEPGTVLGAAALVAGTTVGAGVLALPAVTANAGFPPSAAVITGACLYSIGEGAACHQSALVGYVHITPTCQPSPAMLRACCAAHACPPSHPLPPHAVTGLLVAEVNINTLCELGAGRGVSIRCAVPAPPTERLLDTLLRPPEARPSPVQPHAAQWQSARWATPAPPLSAPSMLCYITCCWLPVSAGRACARDRQLPPHQTTCPLRVRPPVARPTCVLLLRLQTLPRRARRCS